MAEKYWIEREDINFNDNSTGLEKTNLKLSGKHYKNRFQVTDKRHLTRENLDMAKKGNLERETESLLIAAQKNRHKQE